MAPSSHDQQTVERQEHAKKRKKKRNGWIRRNGFLILLLLCTCIGYGLGISLRYLQLSTHTIYLVGFPGQLVIRAFMMIIVPLLFCSLVLGISSLQKGGDAKMVVITITLFLCLSTFSAIMGATAGHLVHPGHLVTGDKDTERSQLSGRKGVILDSMLDLLWNSIPGNIVEATFSKEYTHVETLMPNPRDVFNETDDKQQLIYKKSIKKMPGINFMGLLVFSILFGCAIAASGSKTDQLLQVIEQLNLVVMSIMKYFLKLLPLGMFFWMFREGLENTSPERMFGYLGVFLATSFGCIAFHQFVLLPSLYLIIVRRNPIPFHLNLLPAILTAFGTSSSAATLPATVKCAEETNRLNRCVTRFVLPLGMVVHMNGGTFYVTMSCIFLAQLEGIDLGTAETVVLCLTSILLFISAPATAGGGNPVYLLTAMAAAGIDKPQFVSLILSMEWLMERFRTVMNVVADSYVAALVEKLCWDKLPEDSQESIEFESPVLDGYRHDPPDSSKNVCRQCGCQVELE